LRNLIVAVAFVAIAAFVGMQVVTLWHGVERLADHGQTQMIISLNLSDQHHEVGNDFP
jgi:hypothetical protein